MRNIDLVKLHQEIEAFVAERDWDQFHSVKNLSMALTVEASELQEIFQWMPEAESNLVERDESLRGRVSDELADVFVYLLRIASKTGIDLEAAVRSKMQQNALKYPVALARGNSRKYDQL